MRFFGSCALLSFNRAPEGFVGVICAMRADSFDEFWREARVGAGIYSATALRRALPVVLAEIVCFHGRIRAGKVSGARLNDAGRNFKNYASHLQISIKNA